jgi:hypothetical protein
MIKIDWLVSNPDPTVGSYRIWIRDAHKVLKKFGIDSKIIHRTSNTRWDEEIRQGSFIILSKGDAHLSTQFASEKCKKLFNYSGLGAINVPVPKERGKAYPLDFVIAGSVEEKLSLSEYYPNVVLVNLIENIYSDKPLKIHKPVEQINIGYHGWHPHIDALKYWSFAEVLNQVSKTTQVKVTTVTNCQKKTSEALAKFPLKNIYLEHKRWSFNDVVNDISEFDICIVPNCKNISKTTFRANENPNVGEYETDYVLRFKNKSNAGRAFVAYQLGIPVISDLTPSNMPMLHDSNCGFIVDGGNGFYNSLFTLLNHQNRNIVAANAHKRFNEIYSFKGDLLRLIQLFKNWKTT